MSRRKKHRGSRPGPETPPPETPRIEPVQLPLPAEAASRADEPLTDPALAVVGADVLGDSGELVTSPEYMSQPVSEWSSSIMQAWTSWDRNVWVEITKEA